VENLEIKKIQIIFTQYEKIRQKTAELQHHLRDEEITISGLRLTLDEQQQQLCSLI
jgi:hypothetical protein